MNLFGKFKTTIETKDMDAPIKVLGSNCKSCHALYENTVKAVEELQMDAAVSYVSDLAMIAAYGVMVTPALVVNEKVVSTGKVLTVEAVKELLQK